MAPPGNTKYSALNRQLYEFENLSIDMISSNTLRRTLCRQYKDECERFESLAKAHMKSTVIIRIQNSCKQNCML